MAIYVFCLPRDQGFREDTWLLPSIAYLRYLPSILLKEIIKDFSRMIDRAPAIPDIWPSFDFSFINKRNGSGISTNQNFTIAQMSHDRHAMIALHHDKSLFPTSRNKKCSAN